MLRQRTFQHANAPTNKQKQVRGKVPELANHHSASRVLQFVLKEGADADRAAMMAEVQAHLVPLSKSKYGRHLVQKLIGVASKAEVPGAFAFVVVLMWFVWVCVS